MQASPFPSAPIAGARATDPDTDMVVELFIGNGAEVCVFHDRPFSKTVSWLEYDTANSKVDFVMEDGDIRNFGIAVDRKLRAYFLNTHLVSMIQMNPVTKKVENGVDLPLIVHAA